MSPVDATAWPAGSHVLMFYIESPSGNAIADLSLILAEVMVDLRDRNGGMPFYVTNMTFEIRQMVSFGCVWFSDDASLAYDSLRDPLQTASCVNFDIRVDHLDPVEVQRMRSRPFERAVYVSSLSSVPFWLIVVATQMARASCPRRLQHELLARQ